MKKITLLILIFLTLGIFFIWQGIYLPKDLFGEEKFFLVEKGQGLFQIAEDLEKEGLIKNAFYFKTYVLLKNQARSLQAGEYLLSPSMRISEITQKIISGDIVKEEITIIEGWNLKDIGFYFENRGMFQAEELYDERADLEGYFFPDTYQTRRGATLEEIIKMVTGNFNKKLTKELREEIERQGKTISEIVTMASIVEKEVQTLEDKEIVSGIFWERIKEKKPLQSCATIAYIKGVNQWRYSSEDTRIESPYNTYLNLGLPIGPISNPGLDSIKAAIFPKKTDYNYFLNDPETGKTIFSKTLEEHNIAKVKYLK